jgi:hypothetical protein
MGGRAVREEIVVVSGLPRSGTSLMMQMLDRGGLPVVTDRAREADVDNPRGYYEFEAVKRVKQDASWIPELRGKAVKAVSQLLYDFPASESYRIVFMERDLDEMLLSQEKMLVRLGRPAAPAEPMKQAYLLHLERLYDWLRRQPHLRTLFVRYGDLVARPAKQATRVNEFLDRALDVEAMIAAVDPALYRNRIGTT